MGKGGLAISAAVCSLACVTVTALIYDRQVGKQIDMIESMNKTIQGQDQIIQQLRGTEILLNITRSKLGEITDKALLLGDIIGKAVYVEDGSRVVVWINISPSDLEKLKDYGVGMTPGGNVTVLTTTKVGEPVQ